MLNDTPFNIYFIFRMKGGLKMLYVSNPGVGRLPRMNALKYHFGLQMQCYPSFHQIKMIDYNANNDRFLYNRDVAINRAQYAWHQLQLEWTWKQLDMPVNVKYHRAYWDVIRYLPFRLNWIVMKQIDVQIKDKDLKHHYEWFDSKLVDSLVAKNVHKKFASALHMMKETRNWRPNFHKKGYRLTYQTSCSYRGDQGTNLFTGSVHFIDESHLWVPKLGKIRVAGSQLRILQRSQHQLMRIGTVTICHRNDNRFTISLQLGSNQPFVNVEKQMKHRIEDWKLLGIDLNASCFLMDSNGHDEANPRLYKNNLAKLKRLQRAVSRKQRAAKREGRNVRDSKRYQKNRIRLAKLHQHIKDARKDFTNQQSSDIIKNHDFVVTERLQSKNLLKNHALAQSIQDVGWRQFISQLNYKAELYHKVSIQVDPKYTTQMCSNCSFRMGTCGTHKIKLGFEVWDCPCCGVHHVRDYNAAKNILARGINDYLASIGMSKSLQKAKKHYLQFHYSLASKMLKLPLSATH